MLFPYACATPGRAPPSVAVPTLAPSTNTVTLCTGAPVAVSAAHPAAYNVAPFRIVGFQLPSPTASTYPISCPAGATFTAFVPVNCTLPDGTADTAAPLAPPTNPVTLCTGAPVAVSAAHPAAYNVPPFRMVGFQLPSPAASTY